MKVICHKSPRKTGGFAVDQDTVESIQKIITVGIKNHHGRDHQKKSFFD